MFHFKKHKAVIPPKEKFFKLVGSHRSLTLEVQNRNRLTKKQILPQSTITSKSTDKIVQINVNRKEQYHASSSLHAAKSTGSRENEDLSKKLSSTQTAGISSLIVNKWPLPISQPQAINMSQSSYTTDSNTSHVIKNISTNGRTLPLKILKIVPATKYNLKNSNVSLNNVSKLNQPSSIGSLSTPDKLVFLSSSQRYDQSIVERFPHSFSLLSSDDEQESVNQNDLREEVKEIKKQNAQILARMDHSVSFAFRLKELKDVDEIEATMKKKHRNKKILANYLRKRIKVKSEAVMEMIELMFTTELISKFNTTGMREKRSFKTLEFNSVIKDVSGLDHKYYYLELARVIHTLSTRFRRAKAKNQTQQ